MEIIQTKDCRHKLLPLFIFICIKQINLIMIISIKNKILIIRLIHTAIWVFFNLVIFYFLCAEVLEFNKR